MILRRPVTISICTASESRRLELRWDDYVSYAVRNESYWKAEPQEPQIVNQLSRRFDSALLQFVATATL